MIKYFLTPAGSSETAKIDSIQKNCWIDLTSPTAQEIDNIVTETKIDSDLITKMLDEDELPRIEYSDNATLIVVDVPTREDDEFITYPLGIIITKTNYLITVSSKSSHLLNDFRNSKIPQFSTAKKNRFLIQVLNRAAAEYLQVLKRVSRDIDAKEDVLKKSAKNDDLIDLLTMQKTLVYFEASLKENGLVLEKLDKNIILPLYEADKELLDDTVVENNQAIDMASLYRKILGSISETYATVINNEQNNIMKFLAGITIVLSIPTIISSFLGMNVPFGEAGVNPHSAAVILAASVLLSIGVAYILKKRDLL